MGGKKYHKKESFTIKGSVGEEYHKEGTVTSAPPNPLTTIIFINRTSTALGKKGN